MRIADDFDELPDGLAESLGIAALTFLLDTHVLLWWMGGEKERIGKRALAAIASEKRNPD